MPSAWTQFFAWPSAMRVMPSVRSNAVCSRWTTSPSWTFLSAWRTLDVCRNTLTTGSAWPKTRRHCRCFTELGFLHFLNTFVVILCSEYDFYESNCWRVVGGEGAKLRTGRLAEWFGLVPLPGMCKIQSQMNNSDRNSILMSSVI